MLLAEIENAGLQVLEALVPVGAEVAGDVAVIGTVLVLALHQQLGGLAAEDATDSTGEGKGKGLVSLFAERANVPFQRAQDIAKLVQILDLLRLIGGKSGSELQSNGLTGDDGRPLFHVGLKCLLESLVLEHGVFWVQVAVGCQRPETDTMDKPIRQILYRSFENPKHIDKRVFSCRRGTDHTGRRTMIGCVRTNTTQRVRSHPFR